MMVNLEAGAAADIVYGTFDESERASLAALKQGQKVTMQCQGGTTWVSLPDLVHCKIAKVE